MGRWEKDRIIDEEDKKKMMMGWKRFLCLDNQKIYYHRCCYVHGLDTFSDAAAITLARLGDVQSRVHLAPISSITSGNVDVIDSARVEIAEGASAWRHPSSFIFGRIFTPCCTVCMYSMQYTRCPCVQIMLFSLVGPHVSRSVRRR